MPRPPAPPEPPIHRAARLGDIAALERLLAQGVDVNMRADLEVDNGPHLRQLTPLMVAARSIDGATVETLRYLLDRGAALRAVSEGGGTAAWYAAGRGGRWDFHPWGHPTDQANRLCFLLDAGLDACQCTFNGRSLLVEACDAGDPARVRLLLERGAQPNPTFDAAENQRRTRELCASIQAQYPNLELPSNLWDESGMSPFQIPLFVAAQSGSGACVRLLLDAGADVQLRDDAGRTALFHARSGEVAEALLSAGADLHATAHGEDALQEILKDDCRDQGLTWRFEAADALLAAGASPEVIRSSTDSRLQRLAAHHAADAVEYLLTKGVRASAAALRGICWQGESQDAQTNRRCERIIGTLIAAGADPQQTASDGSTALHEAAFGDWGNATAVRTLLQHMKNPDPALQNGTTPLMLAASRGEVECIRLLLEAGADPMRANAAGQTAISFAQEHVETWRQIIRKPPDVPRLLNESDEQIAARHAQALAEAEQALALLVAHARS